MESSCQIRALSGILIIVYKKQKKYKRVMEMLDRLELKAYGKINLGLDVVRKREDGYHDLCMVMQSVTLHDTLTLTPNEGQGLRVKTNLRFLPTGDKNLAAAAALRFWEALGREPESLDIEIQKRIPVCAGMAGGSSDGAAVLRALNEQAGSPFTPTELAKVGEKVGSDVPYCVLGGTALAEGRGEVLTDLAPLPPCWIVVCKPEDSMKWYEQMWRYSVELFRSLDIPVRQLECCSGDLADLKVKSCDIEAWSPRQQKYFEVCSCSNLGDAQARRLRIRYKDENGKMQLCHTLNNTCVAPPRMLIAFLENNLQADGSVKIPEVLWPYMGGTKVLLPKKK